MGRRSTAPFRQPVVLAGYRWVRPALEMGRALGDQVAYKACEGRALLNPRVNPSALSFRQTPHNPPPQASRSSRSMASLNLWVFLPPSWDLGNVRAILALIINFLCVVGIWIISYSTWKTGALKLARSHKSSTRLLSLFSPSGVGDVLDILPLLRSKNISIRLLAQLVIPGAVIATLSAVAIVSAPIARYSTRPSSRIQPMLVSGTLASIYHSGIGNALVKWNNTIERFTSAGLPLNQLVDFLPDNTIDWKYSGMEQYVVCDMPVDRTHNRRALLDREQ